MNDQNTPFQLQDGQINAFHNSYGLNKNPKAPKYKGTALINGNEYKVSLWERTTKTGATFFSGRIELAENTGAQSAPRPETIYVGSDTDTTGGDLPF